MLSFASLIAFIAFLKSEYEERRDEGTLYILSQEMVISAKAYGLKAFSDSSGWGNSKHLSHVSDTPSKRSTNE